MIGVIAKSSEHPVVREFFELFKTPWEFYRSDQRYEVLLCTEGAHLDKDAAGVVLIYAGSDLPFDEAAKVEVRSRESAPQRLSCEGFNIPIYGDSVTFGGDTSVVVREKGNGAAGHQQQCGRRIVRVGYDLFREVRILLSAGQPEENAGIPTLELHIALLRKLIVGSGVSLVEIPPVPVGYRLIACLTHDVDHPSIRRHKFDHTMLGFLYRAILGSLIGVLRGRMPLRHLLTNWAAAIKLPFTYVGLARDAWSDFDKYLKLEHGLSSSFFVIPFKNRPGLNGRDAAHKRRAARYGATDVGAEIHRLMGAGCEVGLHGIDAWCDSSKGREELEEIRRITGAETLGVRMHWLYFSEDSPAILENAGANYDSTIGYNETVGYRAGTTQVYKPFSAERLLELPLHIMDTALFFPGHLNLSSKEARAQINRIITTATQFGGVVTVNWHDRSLAPERLWGAVYTDLIDEFKRQGAWFATAAQAVAWFRMRRSATFENHNWKSGAPPATVGSAREPGLPDLQLRVYNGLAHEDLALAGHTLTCGVHFGLETAINNSVAPS